MRLIGLVVLFVAFTGYSVFVSATEGYWGFATLALRERWAMQVLLDLGISISVAWAWLWPDAKQRGISPVPYVVATVPLGSIAVLAYLIHREVKGAR